MSVDHKSGLQLRSLIKKSGELELTLAEVVTPEPAADEAPEPAAEPARSEPDEDWEYVPMSEWGDELR